MSVKSAEEALLEVLKRHPDGASQEEVDRELVLIPMQLRADALNKLLSNRRIQLFNANNGLVYKEVAVEEAAKFKGLNAEELMVYQVIKQAGNSGVWTKDMKFRTNLAQPHITKILKVLETRRLVKAVKNVNNLSRKVYMLFELEPSRDLTGGAWYTENQFDSEFIDVLREACFQYIQRQGDTTMTQIGTFIKQKGFSKVDLRIDDIQTIVLTLVYDGRIDQVDGEGEDDVDDHYRPAVHTIPDNSALTSTPCGVCPVFNECHEDGLVSPKTCLYYDRWLQF
eukprot:gene4425-14557_t